MAQRKLPSINSAHGSETRNIINELIKLFNGMGYTYDEALQKAHDVLSEAERTNEKNNDTNARLDNIIADSGTSSTEVVDARGTHTLLNNRFKENELRAEMDAMKALKSSSIDASSLNLGSKKTAKPFVTFVDDDGSEEVYTRLKPIFESRGVPCTVAIVSDWVTDGNVGTSNGKALTKSQLLELQNAGWEIASHEKRHIAMTNVTDYPTIHREVVQSKAELLSMGFNVKNIVYPYGNNNPSLTEVAKRYYKAGIATTTPQNESLNTSPLDTFHVRRIALGSFIPDGYDDTLEKHKSMIDQAISENAWIIFMTHVWAQDETKDQMIADLIDYIQSQSVEIGNIDDGLDIFGDKISIDGLMRVMPDNHIVSDNIVPQYKTEMNAVTSDDTIDAFKLGGITTTQVNPSGASGFPEDTAGVLVTDNIYEAAGYQRQTYYMYNSFSVYSRYWKTTGEWSPWFKEQYRIDDEVSHDFGSVPAQSSKTLDVTITGVSRADNIIVNTSGALPDGLFVTGRASAIDTVILQIFNIKSTDVNAYGNVYRVAALKNR